MVINDRNDYRAHGHILYRMPLPGVPEKKREKKGAGNKTDVGTPTNPRPS